MKLSDARDAFLEDCRARNLSTLAFGNYKGVLGRLRPVLLKHLFGFAVNEGWIAESSAEPPKSPKNDAAPTTLLAREEIRAMFAAARRGSGLC